MRVQRGALKGTSRHHKTLTTSRWIIIIMTFTIHNETVIENEVTRLLYKNVTQSVLVPRSKDYTLLTPNSTPLFLLDLTKGPKLLFQSNSLMSLNIKMMIDCSMKDSSKAPTTHKLMTKTVICTHYTFVSSFNLYKPFLNKNHRLNISPSSLSQNDKLRSSD